MQYVLLMPWHPGWASHSWVGGAVSRRVGGGVGADVDGRTVRWRVGTRDGGGVGEDVVGRLVGADGVVLVC